MFKNKKTKKQKPIKMNLRFNKDGEIIIIPDIKRIISMEDFNNLRKTIETINPFESKQNYFIQYIDNKTEILFGHILLDKEVLEV